MTYLGAWSSSTSYAPTDAVTYNGSTYIANNSNSALEPDTNSSGSNPAWSLLAAAGSIGPAGTSGAPGTAGAAATISIGTTTTGPSASVTNSGTSSAAILNFTLPQGVTSIIGPNSLVTGDVTITGSAVTQSGNMLTINGGGSSSGVFSGQWVYHSVSDPNAEPLDLELYSVSNSCAAKNNDYSQSNGVLQSIDPSASPQMVIPAISTTTLAPVYPGTTISTAISLNQPYATLTMLPTACNTPTLSVNNATNTSITVTLYHKSVIGGAWTAALNAGVRVPASYGGISTGTGTETIPATYFVVYDILPDPITSTISPGPVWTSLTCH